MTQAEFKMQFNQTAKANGVPERVQKLRGKKNERLRCASISKHMEAIFFADENKQLSKIEFICAGDGKAASGVQILKVLHTAIQAASGESTERAWELLLAAQRDVVQSDGVTYQLDRAKQYVFGNLFRIEYANDKRKA